MEPLEEIQISRLLMQRETILVRIFEIEQELGTLTGEEVLIPEPPPLASLQKRKPKRAKRTAAKPSKGSSPGIRLPTPEPPEENAFRVRYLWQGHAQEEIHQDPRLLEQVLDSGLADLQILEIQIGRISPDGNFLESRQVTLPTTQP